jgi:hypothetical protein
VGDPSATIAVIPHAALGSSSPPASAGGTAAAATASPTATMYTNPRFIEILPLCGREHLVLRQASQNV